MQASSTFPMPVNGRDATKPELFIACACTGLAYIAIYIPYVYFSSAALQVPHDIPAFPSLGNDLLMNVHLCRDTLARGTNDGTHMLFSPLWTLLFGSLAILSDSTLRWSVAACTLLSYFSVCFLAPRLWKKGAETAPASCILALSGLWTYGLRFDIERGQWNAPTLALSLLGLYLADSNRKTAQGCGIAILAIAVHLKLWPIVFTPCLVGSSQRTGQILARFILFLFVNVTFLFVLGYEFLRGYFTALLARGGDIYEWFGNHSLYSYYRQLEPETRLIAPICLVVVVVAVIGMMAFAWRKHVSWRDPSVVLVCLLGGFLLPTTSYDYKLIALQMYLACYFSALPTTVDCDGLSMRLATSTILLACISVMGYSQYDYRAEWGTLLGNNTPYLVMSVLAAASFFLSSTIRQPVEQRTRCRAHD